MTLAQDPQQYQYYGGGKVKGPFPRLSLNKNTLLMKGSMKLPWDLSQC